MEINKTIKYIFRLSFRAIKFYEMKDKIDVIEWSFLKSNTYLKMNKFVFRYVSRNKFEKNLISDNLSSQFLLDILYEIVWDNFKYRIHIYNFLKKIKLLNEKNFIFLSILNVYYCILKKLIFYTFKNLKTKSLDKVDIQDKIVVTIGFPKHSFSLTNTANTFDKKKVFFSFGDFFSNQYGPEYKLYSIDEYSRPNSQNDISINKTTNVKQIDRVILKKRINFSSRLKEKFTSFQILVKTIVLLLFSINKNKIINLYYNLYYIIHIIYKDLFVKNSNVKAIYAFTSQGHLGLIPHSEEYSKKLIYYNYSQNYCEQPTIYLNSFRKYKQSFNHKLALSELSPDAWKLDSPIVGFTDINEYLNTFRIFLNKKFRYKLKVNIKKNKLQIPSMVGFESNFDFNIKGNKKIVSFFDAPPKTRNEAFSTNFLGWPLYELSFLKEVYYDIMSVCEENNLHLLVKPKYDIGYYELAYQEFLKNLLTRYKDNLTIVSPYINSKYIFLKSDAVISIPYTSTQFFAEMLNKPAIFYYPSLLESVYEFGKMDKNLTFGRKNLSKFLSKLNI